jgi:hypothetical protein
MPTAAARQMTTKVLEVPLLIGADKHKRKDNGMRLCLDHANNLFFHLSRSFLLTREQKIIDISYHHYYSRAPSGGVWATKGKMCDSSVSEAEHTQVQKVST